MNERAKHLPAEERKAATVAAMVELAAERNPSEITTAAIAQRMGLTQGALFRHFPTKDAMVQAVMSWVAHALLRRVDKAAQDAASPLAALEAMFMAHVEFVSQYPGVPRMLFGQLQRPEETMPKRAARTLIHHYRDRLITLLERGTESSELPPELDKEAAATLFIGTIQGLVMQSLLVGTPERMRHDASRVFAIYRYGITNAHE